jgi:hypothetical protein
MLFKLITYYIQIAHAKYTISLKLWFKCSEKETRTTYQIWLAKGKWQILWVYIKTWNLKRYCDIFKTLGVITECQV